MKTGFQITLNVYITDTNISFETTGKIIYSDNDIMLDHLIKELRDNCTGYFENFKLMLRNKYLQNNKILNELPFGEPKGKL